VAVVLIGLSFCRARTSPAPIMAVVFTVSTAGALVLCLVTAQLPDVSVFTDETLVGGFFYLGIAGILLPALVSTWAIPVLGAQRTAMFEVIAPIVAIIAAKVWLGTNVASLEYVGIAVIVGSVVLSVRLHRPEHRHHHAVFRGHRESGDAGHPSREAGDAAARNG
jgi:drug/metabolite transporter (DMT)-like permease